MIDSNISVNELYIRSLAVEIIPGLTPVPPSIKLCSPKIETKACSGMKMLLTDRDCAVASRDIPKTNTAIKPAKILFNFNISYFINAEGPRTSCKLYYILEQQSYQDR